MEIDLKTDSRKVKPGDTFIAIRNVNRDGHDYIPQAIKNGATKVIVEEGNYDVETVVVERYKSVFKRLFVQTLLSLFQRYEINRGYRYKWENNDWLYDVSNDDHA